MINKLNLEDILFLDIETVPEAGRTNSTFGFLPTHKPTLKKPKELFFANARRKIERNTENRK